MKIFTVVNSPFQLFLKEPHHAQPINKPWLPHRHPQQALPLGKLVTAIAKPEFDTFPYRLQDVISLSSPAELSLYKNENAQLRKVVADLTLDNKGICLIKPSPAWRR